MSAVDKSDTMGYNYYINESSEGIMQTPNKSLFAVFNVIAENDEISRREISDITGFSQVTVGKAVDILEGSGIIGRVKKPSPGVGRKGDACVLNKNRGVVLFDLSASEALVQIRSIADELLFESKGDDVTSLIIEGLGAVNSLGLDGIMGIGCICADGKIREAGEIFASVIGNSPDVVTEAIHAHAMANHPRFGLPLEIFAKISSSGDGSGAILMDGRIFSGSHGRAGIFDCGENIAEFVRRILEVGQILDVDLIHIACDGEDVYTTVKSILDRTESTAETVTAETRSCPHLQVGLSRMVREKYLASLLSEK